MGSGDAGVGCEVCQSCRMRSLPPEMLSSSVYKVCSHTQSSPISANARLNALQCALSVSAKVPSTSKIRACRAVVDIGFLHQLGAKCMPIGCDGFTLNALIHKL